MAAASAPLSGEVREAGIFQAVASLDALSSFAGLSTAIALAYSSLKNFRYRTIVQDRARKIVSDILLPVLRTQTTALTLARTHECWAILYHLGRIRECLTPEEEGRLAPDEKYKPDRHFIQVNKVKSYGWMYASNFDKYISIFLGCVGSSLIWLFAVDRMHFPAPLAGDKSRLIFLQNASYYYIIIALSCFLTFILFRTFWQWDIKKGGWRRHVLSLNLLLVASIFMGGVLLVTFREHLFIRWWPSLFGSFDESTSFVVCSIACLVCITIPIVLLVIGRNLTDAMMSEIDGAYAQLKAAFSSLAENASLPAAASAGSPSLPMQRAHDR